MEPLKNKSSTNKNIRGIKGQAQFRRKRNSLYIQFPRSLNGGKQKYLFFGKDTPENLRILEDKLFEINRDIYHGEFDITLNKYGLETKDFSKIEKNINSAINNIKFPPKEQNTLKKMLEIFEETYFLTNKKTRQSIHTFKQHKQFLLRAFNFKNTLDFKLLPKDIKKAIKLTKAGTATRLKTVSSLRLFCRLLNIEYDFEGLVKGYKPAPRVLPTDAEIKEGWQKIQIESAGGNYRFRGNGASWGWIFAVIATYGLRPHEILAIDYQKSFKPPCYPLYINEKITNGSKTGSRIVFPIPLEWVDEFDIANPKINYIKNTHKNYTENIENFGDRLSERAKLKGIKFKTYDMRHRYAIRGHECGFPIDDLARWMGHTVAIHTRTYQKYLEEETHYIAYEAGLQNFEELQKIKSGHPSYAALEDEIQNANEHIARLETELHLTQLLVAQKCKD